MKNSDWGAIREVVQKNLLTILGPFLDEDWTPQLNRKCNNILSESIQGIADSLKIPPIPENHEYRARLKIDPVTKNVRVQLRHQLKRSLRYQVKA